VPQSERFSRGIAVYAKLVVQFLKEFFCGFLTQNAKANASQLNRLGLLNSKGLMILYHQLHTRFFPHGKSRFTGSTRRLVDSSSTLLLRF